MMKYVIVALFALSVTACSGGDSKDEPLAATPTPVEVANGGSGEGEIITPAPAPTQDAKSVEVPRVKQAQIVGVLREMRSNGCILKKVASTDGIHYSQLVITCGEPQTVPPVE